MVTGEMVEELILSGADIIKVGIGPGMPHVNTLLFCIYKSGCSLKRLAFNLGIEGRG